MDANVLDSFGMEKDLGVVVDNKLKFDQHINETVKKSNKLVGMMIRHYISFKTNHIMVPVFKTLIRPVLEYRNVVWFPNLKKHVLLIENVQRRFSKN